MRTPSFFFLPATYEDAISVGLRMCAHDAEEAFLMSGLPPVEAAVESWSLTTSMCGEVVSCWIDGTVEMVFGVSPTDFVSSKAGVWMLHTDVPARFGLMFARHSLEALDTLVVRSGFQTVENWCMADHVETVRWLRFLGFSFDVHTFISGRKWLHFFMEADHARSRLSKLRSR